MSLVIPHLELPDFVDVLTKSPIGLERDLPVPAKSIEAPQPRGAQIHLHCLIDVRQRYAEGFDLVPVHSQEQLRRVRPKGIDHIVQARLSGQLRRQRFGLLLQGFQAKPAKVFDDQLETTGRAEARDRCRAA